LTRSNIIANFNGQLTGLSPQLKRMLNKMKNNTKVTLKKPTKKQIQSVLENGVMVQAQLDDMTQIIKADLHHRDENNQTQLTQAFDKILKSDNEEMKQDVKRFVGKQLQTLIKEKPTQLAILEDDMEEMTVTVKKVNKAMVENNDGKYVDSFNEKDLGSYRVVRMHKVKEVLSLAQELAKWMRSKKSEGLYNGDKSTAKEVSFYDFELLKMTVENIERGVEEL
jgi:multidrug efflux pump subunit AcrB